MGEKREEGTYVRTPAFKSASSLGAMIFSGVLDVDAIEVDILVFDHEVEAGLGPNATSAHLPVPAGHHGYSHARRFEVAQYEFEIGAGGKIASSSASAAVAVT